MMQDNKLVVTWSPGDVQSVAEERGIELTEEAAVTFLWNNHHVLEDVMVTHGFEAIRSAMYIDYPETRDA